MSKHKLLLADDSVTIQKVVKLTFADEGIDVDIAGDGDMALLKFAESTPDIVLADVHMPGLNGYEVCERVKQNGSGIPVVLLVGSFEPFDAEEANRVGADGFLTKPFQSIRQLVEVVSNLLASGRAESAPTGTAVSDASDGFDASLAETREMPVYADTADLGDPGMDDEMIETTPAENLFERDTLPRYSPDQDDAEAGPVENSEAEGLEPETVDHSTDAGEDVYVPEVGTPETAGDPVNGEYEFTEAPTADLASEPENILENGGYGEHEVLDRRPRFEIVDVSESQTPDEGQAGDIDDSNLLEIPFVRSIVPPLTKISAEPVAEKGAPALTAEFIEEVTQRVMERLSSGAFRDLVKEVVPQVVREVTEEKMKN